MTSPLELVRTPQIMKQRDGLLPALYKGIPHGFGRMGLRLVAGIFEVITFYVEVPPGYKPLVHPEFVFGDDIPVSQ